MRWSKGALIGAAPSTCIGTEKNRRAAWTKLTQDKTYTELVGILKEHYSPKPSEMVQRFSFNSQFRQPEESASTFVSELQSLAKFCNFGTALEDMLRD